MDLIISEKAIAGRRIATILSKSKFTTKKIGGVDCFEFTKNKKDCLIVPLRGHINQIDFEKESRFWSISGLDWLLNQKLTYKEAEKKIIDVLKKTKNVETIIVATDADREGEAIGVEAYNYIIKNNKNADTKRAYFSALTNEEVEHAFKNLKKLDFNYADSVFARQEIDLLWGAILTRYLSVISNRKGHRFLSAGRVQTPLLNFIVKREIERESFVSEPYCVLKITFEKNKILFEGTHKKGNFFDLELAKKIYEKVKDEKKGVVKSIITKTKTLVKPDPFNTTSFLRAASAIGVNTSQAMNIAESLYQKGLISYPRTDNTVYPASLDLKEILNVLKKYSEYKKFVEEIFKKPLTPSKGKKQTTDHPPIHPVGFDDSLIGAEKKVYDLIARRFLATLSTNAQTENQTITIEVNKEPYIVNGQKIIDAGWKKIYVFSKINETILPELKLEELVSIIKNENEKKKTTPPNRYSEGALIKLMEDQNLGTKSTRPAIIKKLRDRGYIDGTKQIVAKEIAIAVCSVLNKNCEVITKPELTAKTEDEMEEVASGKKQKTEIVNNSRKDLKEIVSTLIKEKDSIANELREAKNSADFIGKCNVCGKNLIIRTSRNNKQFVGCSGYPKCTNTYPLPQKKRIEKTDKVCERCNHPIIKIVNGRKSFEMCLNHKCETKKEYFENKEKNKEKNKEQKQ